MNRGADMLIPAVVIAAILLFGAYHAGKRANVKAEADRIVSESQAEHDRQVSAYQGAIADLRTSNSQNQDHIRRLVNERNDLQAKLKAATQKIATIQPPKSEQEMVERMGKMGYEVKAVPEVKR